MEGGVFTRGGARGGAQAFNGADREAARRRVGQGGSRVEGGSVVNWKRKKNHQRIWCQKETVYPLVVGVRCMDWWTCCL